MTGPDAGQVAAAERAAFEVEWRTAEPSVRRALARRLPRRADQDDVLQETALIAWSQRGNRDPDRPFAPWAWGIARRCLAAWYRLRRRRREASLDLGLVPVVGPVEEPEAAGLTWSRLAEQLGRDACLVQGLLADLPHREIGRSLGLSGRAVTARLFRLRNRLRACTGARFASVA